MSEDQGANTEQKVDEQTTQDESVENKFYSSDEKKSEDNKTQEDVDKKETSTEETDESKAEDKKESEEKKDESEFELKFSDESALTESDKERIASEIKEQGLGKDEAEKYVAVNEKVITNHMNRLAEKHSELVAGWEKETRNDPEIGGEKLDETIADAKLFVKSCSRDADKMMQIFEDNGLGSHPEFLYMFAKAAQPYKDKKEVSGNQASNGDKPLADIMYDSN